MSTPSEVSNGTAWRRILQSQSAAGMLLMAAAVLALAVANSPGSAAYFETLRRDVAGMSVLHWINDGLMALFFLLVGLEIKREFLAGQLASWDRRALPGIAALGGVVVPAAVFIWLSRADEQALRGWAVPTATDIAFALGVLSLLGSRVPASLRVFLAALAIIDDLVAVLVIAVFYTDRIDGFYLGLAAAVLAPLFACNALKAERLSLYAVLGVLLWYAVLRSGVHPTLAGVALALFVPLNAKSPRPHPSAAPLLRLEHRVAPWSAFCVIPLFGFANAGIAFSGMTVNTLLQPATLGVALGLFVGKQLGVMTAVWLATVLGIARLPAGASWVQMYGVALLCGIGFTMSLFIGLLAFDVEAEQEATKLGVLVGSVMSGTLGWLVLRFAAGTPRLQPQSQEPSAKR